GDGIHLISTVDGRDSPLKGKLNGGLDYENVAFSRDARFAAATGEKDNVEVWDLKSGNSRSPEKIKGIYLESMIFSTVYTLFAGDDEGRLYQWNLIDDSIKIEKIGNGQITGIAASEDGRFLAMAVWSSPKQLATATSRLEIRDLKEKKSFQIQS